MEVSPSATGSAVPVLRGPMLVLKMNLTAGGDGCNGVQVSLLLLYWTSLSCFYMHEFVFQGQALIVS